MSVAASGPEYAARLEIDYEPGPRRRLTVLLRFIWGIPIAIVLGLLGGGTASGTGGWQGGAAAAGGIVMVPLVLMILFRQKYPHWWFAFNLEYTRFSTRVASYFALLTDAYPSTTDGQNVRLEIDYPDVENDLNRWLPLVKWILAFPHYIVLLFLGIAAFAITVIAWFAILFTGRYPVGLHSFVVGVGRWGLRVQAYAFLL